MWFCSTGFRYRTIFSVAGLPWKHPGWSTSGERQFIDQYHPRLSAGIEQRRTTGAGKSQLTVTQEQVKRLEVLNKEGSNPARGSQ